MPEPEKLGSIIARGNVPGLKKKRQRLDLLKVNWEHVAGGRMSEHSAPTRLIRGTLTVAADGPAWAAELSMATEDLLRKIRNIMGDNGVKKIRVQSRGKSAPEGAGGRHGEPERGKGEDLEIEGEIGEQIGAVPDEEMRRALARLVRSTKSGKQSDHSEE
ncbi:MAG: DciA family protein [Candidatus Geothermincolia bacterium]